MSEDDDLKAFLNIAAGHRLLTAPEEKALGRIVQVGKEPMARQARNELVLCNVRLVVSVARYYRNRGLPQSDIVQYGIIGLNRAAEKFDPERDIRFSTYATLWIKQAIQRGLSSGGSAIRLPSTVAASRAKVRAVQSKYPEADTEFIADLLDLDVKEVSRALDAAEVVTSLDREITSDEHTHSLLDSMPDLDAPDPSDVEDDLAPELRAGLAALEKTHRRVLEMHFGLTGKAPLTVNEIAAKLDVSVNTIKRIRDEATEFLQHRLSAHV